MSLIHSVCAVFPPRLVSSGQTLIPYLGLFECSLGRNAVCSDHFYKLQLTDGVLMQCRSIPCQTPVFLKGTFISQSSRSLRHPFIRGLKQLHQLYLFSFFFQAWLIMSVNFLAYYRGTQTVVAAKIFFLLMSMLSNWAYCAGLSSDSK